MKNKKLAYAVIAVALLGVAGFFIYQSQRTDAPPLSETDTYVAAAFAAIVPTWDEQEMIKHQGPYMRQLDKGGQHTAQLFTLFKQLGAFKEAKPCREIYVKNTFPAIEGGVPAPTETVNYHCATVFEKDSAQVAFILAKENGAWGIAGLHVFSQYIDELVKAKPATK